MKSVFRPALLMLTWFWLVAGAWAAPEEIAVKLSSGNEIVSQRYGAPGPTLAVWITGQYGRLEEEHRAAADLAARGVETWVTDFIAPYFLPLLPSSMNQVPDQDLSEWLESLQARNPGRRIVLMASGRASSLVFRGVEDWRRRHPQATGDIVGGALLMFPLLYQELQPGQEPDYDPVAAQTRLDLVILQPKSSAGYWWRDRLKSFLEHAGSRVRLQVLPGLRDGFYRRSDITPPETAAAARLGQIILDGLQPLLENP